VRQTFAKAGLRVVSWLDSRSLPRAIAHRQRRNPLVRAVWTRASRPLRWRAVPILSGPARGMRINLHGSAVAFATGTAERPLQLAIERELRPGATFFDIGANVGFMALIAARAVGPSGRVVAFEPVPENVAAIRENMALNGVDWFEVHEAAVAEQPGRADLILSGVSAFSRLASTSTPSEARGRIEVEVTSIDAFMAAGGPLPDVVKIDVEGAELEVIAGMRGMLERHRPVILCEVHDSNAAYAELMGSLGYAPLNLDGELPVQDAGRNAHTIARPLGGSG